MSGATAPADPQAQSDDDIDPFYAVQPDEPWWPGGEDVDGMGFKLWPSWAVYDGRKRIGLLEWRPGAYRVRDIVGGVVGTMKGPGTPPRPDGATRAKDWARTQLDAKGAASVRRRLGAPK